MYAITNLTKTSRDCDRVWSGLVLGFRTKTETDNTFPRLDKSWIAYPQEPSMLDSNWNKKYK